MEADGRSGRPKFEKDVSSFASDVSGVSGGDSVMSPQRFRNKGKKKPFKDLKKNFAKCPSGTEVMKIKVVSIKNSFPVALRTVL